MNRLIIEMTEWDRKLPEKGNKLYHCFLDEEVYAQQTAEFVSRKGLLQVTEYKNGIAIETNSHVGTISLGSIQVNIRPKLDGMPLYTLLKYAYGLRDLEIISNVKHNINSFPFYDLLILQLWAETEELLHRGLNRSYTRISDDLQTLRGRVDIRQLANQGGVASASLPCVFFQRIEDNLLNRVLLAGLKLASRLTDDLSLRIKLNRLSALMTETVVSVSVNRNMLSKALHSIDRLNEIYRPAIEIINLLFESQGNQLEDSFATAPINGFLFDMNMFFQKLLSRFMHEYLSGYELLDEYTLREMFSYSPGFNLRNRKAPRPRPDFAIMKDKKVVSLLDAKYRDLWDKGLPSHILYQLAVYAMSGMGNQTSMILYPTMDMSAKEQKIDISHPTSGEHQAQVILRPVLLEKLAGLIENRMNDGGKCAAYVRELGFG
ncbi:MAG: restriction endonuclease [Bacillota bacterium]|nr:restriction endonuclease [Bacillota bacterium]